MPELVLTPPQPFDDRFNRFREFIEKAFYWRNQIRCPWDGSEARALKTFLRANPYLSEKEFCICLRNFVESQDHPPGERPRKFLPRLTDYAVEPLDRFGRSFNATIVTKQDQIRAGNAAVFAEARRNRQLATEDAGCLPAKGETDTRRGPRLASGLDPLFLAGD